MKPKTPLITVIAPIYNRKHFLPQLFSTIFSQDYDNYEVIIVDDGSNDGSFEWIENNKSAFKKEITYLKQENAGHYAARNNALNHAKGELIAFQDSDDEWPEYHLSRMADIFTKNPDLDWVFGKLQRINHETRKEVEKSNFYMPNGEFHPFLQLHQEKREDGLSVIQDEKIGLTAILSRVPGSTQSAVIKAAVFEKHRFDESYRTAYDQFFAVKVVLDDFKFGYVDEYHQIYHIHDDNISLVAGGDAPKREKSALTHIRGYNSIYEVELTSEEKSALNLKLSDVYAWDLSVAYRDQSKFHDEYSALKEAVKLTPLSLAKRKTLIMSLLRKLVNKPQNQ